MRELRKTMLVGALVAALAVATAALSGCYQDSTSRARDLAAGMMNEYGPDDAYPGKPHWEDGHPDRTRLTKPCDTPDGLMLPPAKAPSK
jgi:hypothetical protein